MNSRLAILLCGLILVLQTKVSGERISIGRLPTKAAIAGFVLDVEMDAVAGNGYQPFYLVFTPQGKAFTHDRHIRVSIAPRNYDSTDLDFWFDQDVTLPEGSGRITFPVHVPHYYPWETFRIRVYENGRIIRTADRNFGIGNGLRARFAQQLVSVGILHSAKLAQDADWKVYPDVRTLVTVLGEGPIPEDVKVKRLKHQAAWDRAIQVQPAFVQFRSIDQSRLHDNWLGYSQLDVIVAPAPVLRKIEANQPEKFSALVNWLTAGGNLWIYAMDAIDDPPGAFFSNLKATRPRTKQLVPPQKVNAFLALSETNDTTKLTYEPWNGVSKYSSQYGFDKKMQNRAQALRKLRAKEHPISKTVRAVEMAKQLTVGDFGLGKVITIDAEDPFPGSFQFWRSVANLHASEQLHWSDRMGIDVPRGNDNYWMWLIPSVGQPPVKSFVLLNTLFAILVGPLCYFFFRKRERLYLLYFFAPFFALLVTLGLFAYALSADGLGTKVRIRQLTWLDLKQQPSSVTQSRQTYYAALGSSSGITVPKDMAIFPVRNTPAYSQYYRGNQTVRAGSYRVSQQSQHLAGGFLPPRDQVQFLTTRPDVASKSLQVTWNETGGQVTNHLPYAISCLVACNEDGTHWQANDLAAGATLELKPATTRVADLLNSEVLPPRASVPMLQNNSRRNGGPGTGAQLSLLEKRLADWSRSLPVNSFLAIAELDTTEIGVEGAKVLNSVHVVMGRLP